MSQPPPQDLMQWPKTQLAREVQRLRAITREHAESVRSDSRPEGAPPMISLDNDPHGRGNVVLDLRGAVLLDAVDVSLVDRNPGSDVLPVAMLVLGGRVNYDRRRSQTAFIFDTDGAAAIVSQLAGLAARAAGPFAEAFSADLDRRMRELPSQPQAAGETGAG